MGDVNRYRMVTRTSTFGSIETHVSSVVLARKEASQHLQVEETMHRLAGWSTVLRDDELVCVRPDRIRTIGIRETEPFDDTL